MDLDVISSERDRLMRQRGRHVILCHSLAICAQLQNLKAPAVDAVGVPGPLRRVQTGTLRGIFHGLRIHARLEHLKPTPVYLGKGTRKGRRDRADQIVYGARTASPINASVLRGAAAEVGPLL